MKAVANALAVVAILGFAMTASATPFSAGGGGITDGGVGCSDASAPSTVFPVITIPGGAGDTIDSVELNGLQHTWAGDLEITLDGPAGYNTHLLDQPGASGTGCGSSSDFVASNTYDWANSGGLFPESPGNPIPSGTFQPTADPGGPSTPLPSGINTAGDWTLTITDHSGADTGSLGGWTINVTPEPSTLGLLAIGGLALLRRRR